MISLDKNQVEKLFSLASLEVPQQICSNDISRALVEIEKKLISSSCAKSELESSMASSVLIIDDLELSVHQLSLLLTKCGYNVNIARSAVEAIDQFKKNHYQYVLLDLFLPDPEEGLKVLETFNNFEKTKEDNTKIIVISGTDDKELISRCFLKGASEFVQKTPEWHKNILNFIRWFESQKTGNIQEINTNVEDRERKIVTILVNNLQKSSILQDLEKEIMTLVNSGLKNIIFDMKNISNIDSNGIGVLIFGYKACAEHNGCFKLCNVRSSINEALSYVFLHNIMQIYKDKESALNSFEDKVAR
ncbi:MAG: response regulator [bacterium]